jgi:N-acetylmuramoyl-L-alanine amidase
VFFSLLLLVLPNFFDHLCGINSVLMTCRVLMIFLVFGLNFSFAQIDSVLAQPGDGIFSLLRKEGIPPIKYYVEFLEINKENIRNASELIEGKTYKLPHAPDSFKNRGRKILVDQGSNLPLFQEELVTMRLRDSTLKNSVYYLLHAQEKEGTGAEVISKELKQLSAQLLSKGATVFVLENANGPVHWDENNVATIGGFTTIINQQYLKNTGKAQRTIVLHDVNTMGKDLFVTVGHHATNMEGRRLSTILQEVLRKNALLRTGKSEGLYDFKDPIGVYLAKNLLPPVVVLTLNTISDDKLSGIKVRSKQGNLAQILDDGLQLERVTANTEFTEE